MDGRVAAIRKALDEAGYSATLRFWPTPPSSPPDSTDPSARPPIQLHNLVIAVPIRWTRNIREAMHEIELDIEEGADMIMVKPAMPYLE